jgi:hypothetical protein
MDYAQADKRSWKMVEGKKESSSGGDNAATSRKRLNHEIGMPVPTRLNYGLGKAENSSGEHCPLSYEAQRSSLYQVSHK